MEREKYAKSQVNSKLINGSVLAMMMVVAIHTAGRDLHEIDAETMLWWLEALGHYGVFLIAVPFFFFCSGYFLAGHMKIQGWWRQECLKRVRTLIIPYIIWSIVYAFFPVVITIVTNLHHGREAFTNIVISRQFWINTFGLSPFRLPGMFQLWYVRTLVMFVILSLILPYCLGRYARWWLMLLFVASLVLGIRLMSPNSHRIDLFFSKFMNLQGLFYFSFGVWIRLKGVEIGENTLMYQSSRGRGGLTLAVCFLAVGLSIVILSAVFCHCTGKKVESLARILFVPPLLFAYLYFIPVRTFPTWLISTSFPVFVMHTLVWKTIGVIHPIHINSILEWSLKWTIGFFVPVLAAFFLHRFTPRIARFIFGGR